jgi:ATP-dependent helicase/nuclease subunit B
MDLGNLYHEALRKIVTATLREKLDWANIPEKIARDLVWNCTEEVGQELREELMISSARNRHLLGWIGRTLEKITATQRAAARRGEFRPALAEMVFGSGAKVPALLITTPKGNRLELRGKIDRVDLHLAGRAFSIIDYKTSSKRLELDRVWHGLSLQMLIYMVVIQEHGEKIWGAKTEAAAGLYVELLRRLKTVDDPADEPSSDDPRFDLRIKPRGVVNEEFLQAFDNELAAGESSDVLAVQLKKDGSVYATSTDVLRGEDIEALLNHVREKVAELADRILEGFIEANPYRLGTETPCPLCDYRSICRFQPGVNRYLYVQRMDRNSVLQQMADKSITPSPGTPGEGGGEGLRSSTTKDPHPNPLPEYRARGQSKRGEK